ncbi:MAG: hypothetical protein WBO00_04500, partial [Steroidobacteraceae bacterium]
MTLDADGPDEFEFPAHRPAELAARIERAIEAFPAPGIWPFSDGYKHPISSQADENDSKPASALDEHG